MQTEAIVSVLFLLSLEGFEFLRVRRESSDVFSMKLGYRLFYFLLIWGLLLAVWQRQTNPMWPYLLGLGTLVLIRPNTLAITHSGAASYTLWGLHRRFVAWSDVLRVTSDWEEENFKFWTFTGYKVSVIGRDGTRIDHTIFHRHQAKFLDDLRAHTAISKFAPGLADWHP